MFATIRRAAVSAGLWIGWFMGTTLAVFGVLVIPFVAMAAGHAGDYGDNVDAGLPLAVLRLPWEPLLVLAATFGFFAALWASRREPRPIGEPGPDPYVHLVDPWTAMPKDIRP